MLRTLALLSLVAAPTFGVWEKGFSVTFCADPSKFGSECFVPLPQNASDASSSSWEIVNKPRLPHGYEVTELWCPKNDYSVCVLYDRHGNLAGLQIALNPENAYKPVFDWTEAGFTEWHVTADRVTTKYWTTQQFFLTPKDLATDASLTNHDSEYLVQGDVYVTGFGGSLLTVPTKHEDITNSIYTFQSCIFAMGNHYYYNMTKDMECNVNSVATYFSLDYDEQNIGIGFMLPVKYEVPSEKKNQFEYPSKSEIKMIVPDAPDCLHNYGDYPGVLTMHTYFIKYPYHITCQ